MVPPPPVLRSWSRAHTKPFMAGAAVAGEAAREKISVHTGCLPALKPACGRWCSSERPGGQKCWEGTCEGEKGMDGREAVPCRASGTAEGSALV